LQFTLTPRRYFVLLAVMLTAALGDTCLSLGMKHVGSITLHRGTDLILALREPWILAGIFLLLGFFAAQITALSWADLTFVLPATSFSYVIMTLLARFALHEHVSLSRWLGVLFITAGVGFVARGPSLTTAPQDSAT
jgi:drug/metabolite transporter (DMT)-like permease